MRMPTSPHDSLADPAAADTEGADVLLLTTTSAAPGSAARTVRLGYARRGESFLVVASDPDAPGRLPAWYQDLLDHPVVGVEIGDDSFQALAIPAGAPAPTAPAALADAPGTADGAAPAPPVVVLERATAGESPRRVRTLADKLQEVHGQLRAQLRLVTDDVDAHLTALAAHEGPGAPPAPSLGFQIRQRCLAFCQALEFHHTAEDGHLFPGIAQYHPYLAEVFDRLSAEHRTVARLQDGLVALLADLGTVEPARFRAELTEMTAELTAHLDYEEEMILPLLADVPWPPPAR
ncbi:nitroreductase/quinone reductase family protein [Streptomyces sp. NBC_01498]|uniref:nitroreductase/quinone reductase family protein n=1 Tax=Streptomyces sp. NBC_01498 TaxID=2975870 RepID=UPI002E7C206B|nr:nitroreductase/quinone reductase family protein [Streptomyces sp. NBC_01498]WTL26218.1 nitroreductase/quinone reductase family protein [Streptomyces sp. NBC_01498]